MVLGGCRNTMAKHGTSPHHEGAILGVSMLQSAFWKYIEKGNADFDTGGFAG